MEPMRMVGLFRFGQQNVTRVFQNGSPGRVWDGGVAEDLRPRNSGTEVLPKTSVPGIQGRRSPFWDGGENSGTEVFDPLGDLQTVDPAIQRSSADAKLMRRRRLVAADLREHARDLIALRRRQTC